jgi:hypothetical protein
MPDVKIYQNKDRNKGRKPPSKEQAIEAMQNIGADDVDAIEVPKDRIDPIHTLVTFSSAPGNYQTSFEAELPKVVRDKSVRDSWIYVWG